MDAAVIPLGVGYYSRAEAARLLGLTPSRLRRWVSGYTFWLESADGRRRRDQRPVIPTDLPVIDGSIALSFVELMELRIVKACVDKGAPLQRVRSSALRAREYFGVRHPFASRRVFMDERHNIVAELNDEAGGVVVQLSGRGRLQLLSGQLVESYLDEIEFDSGTIGRWWPLGPTFPVVVDPHRAFGSPTIVGSRVRTETAVSLARATDKNQAAAALGVSVDEIVAAVKYEELLAAA